MGVINHREAFIKSPGDFKPIYDSKEPWNTPLPSPWREQLSDLQKMIIVRCLRPDKIVPTVTEYVTSKLGKRFVQPPPFDLSKSYMDSNSTIPLVFVLSSGADPMASKSYSTSDCFTKCYFWNNSILPQAYWSLPVTRTWVVASSSPSLWARARAPSLLKWYPQPCRMGHGCVCRIVTWLFPGCLP